MCTRTRRLRLVPVLLVAGSIATPARATPEACRDAIVAAGARYTQAAVKALASCRRHHVEDCAGDARTVSALGRAASRLQLVVTQRCCGTDGVCGTADDAALASVG